MSMPSKPPRRRTVDVGIAPRVRRNPNVEPPEQHRCQVCRQMRPDCVRQMYPPEPARWTCHTCLEAAGQMSLTPRPAPDALLTS